ncbi:nucleotidyltransferase domain-containing protein [Porcipelethomonas ammoniilytica]|jgi:predicted nucleotidyltransferase|uniref:nucleotidyltransferase family protein n=1 Tax=Porcipelethomonas ammoniilytica TaxID=2981722 RepID=UPI000822D48F|nr:nucleotidyltransferase domain-containing protein [Porcipelethomonas ammoniilytica]MCU6720533.1 nucleotidyltransferase domain-containing protein [Porcipelethomonas ammoniilytica]SCJ16481.1 Predicted nucleotidyltransferases [uncultured Ruminococcus sp.]
MTNRIYKISEIKEIVSPIAQKYGAERIYLFGSYAKGEATSQSDIDLRIDKGKICGMLALSGLRVDLLEQFQKNVDLLTTGSLDKDFLRSIENEEVLIYGEKQ